MSDMILFLSPLFIGLLIQPDYIRRLIGRLMRVVSHFISHYWVGIIFRPRPTQVVSHIAAENTQHKKPYQESPSIVCDWSAYDRPTSLRLEEEGKGDETILFNT